MDNFRFDITNLPTPCYLVDESLIEKNMQIMAVRLLVKLPGGAVEPASPVIGGLAFLSFFPDIIVPVGIIL